jgi:hypothetical protein
VDKYVSEGQNTQPPTGTFGQIITQTNSLLLFSGELDNSHYEAVLQLQQNII